MKTLRKSIRNLGITVIVGFASCILLAKDKSVSVTNKTAGLNGSFEIVDSGLPVNWIFYTAKTVASGDFDISTDQKEFHSGQQSLRFAVRKCSGKGGHLSPGVCREFKARPGETYKISFWAKNDGCEFRAKVGGVSAFKGQYQTMVKSSETFDGWRKFSIKYTIPKKMNALRLELNILRPGTFWIDDVEIEKLTE